jgi:soluble lytic murein transglycosylase-like protein
MEEESHINGYSAVLTRLILLIVGISTIALTFILYTGHITPRTAIAEKGEHKFMLQEEEASPETLPDVVPAASSLSPVAPAKKTEHHYYPIIHKVADRYEVDPALVKAIIMAESNYNPRAISRRGARGLMQLMPDTAEALGVVDSFNPEHNINGGVKYFRQLLDTFDDNTELALAAYNAGSRKVRKYQGIPPFRATQIYIEKVFAYYQIYKEKASEEADIEKA